ncbi:hypothetical protein DFH07DRAFT_308727 [Mycena maculata]|uniref:Uncharacterized protein n=1 Tax=Mycena maculata TaxID=230809 RepID=A0AAD7HHH6_9AGAR|nr:hypothetical protein DFH07DRAFT_308727 [Mycena maculata]
MGITPGQKKAVEEVLDALTSATGPPRKRQLAGMFLELVDREDWPEYYEVIPEPRCLNNIRNMLEKNRYKDPLDAYTDLSLVFLNALFYNEPDSQIATDAQTLKNLLESEWKSKPLPTPRDSPPPSSPQKVHEPAPKQAPRPPPTPTPAPAEPTTVSTPAQNTSTFVHSKPTPILPAPVSPVDPPPAPDDLDSESDSEVEDLTDGAYDPPLGTPTDTQIVRQLERGLLRYAPVLSEDGGWMADVKHERHLEIVQAIKAYRDPAGVKLSTALDPGIPDDKTPISFRLLESRSRSKTFYTSSRPFDSDVARMFESGRRYYLERAGGVAGVGGEEWGRVVALQRVVHAFTSAHPPALPLSRPLVIPPPLRAAGALVLDSVGHKGFILRPGDYVHISSGSEAEDEPKMGLGLGRPGRPLVARVVGCWRDDEGESGVSVQWYLRAEEISHLMPATRSIGAIDGEVIQTDKTTHHLLPDVIERVACQHISSAPRGRPRAPVWYPGWPLYVCGYRYDAARGAIRRIRRAEWFSPGGGGDTEGGEAAERLDLFERPVRLGTGQARKQGVVVDRSVVSAAGVAVTAVEKLGPETTRHFERDPTTGEVLWFPGPPLHVSRVPPPRHRLEYLHFLARKYNPEVEEPQAQADPSHGNINGNGNGITTVDFNGVDDSMGSDDGAAQQLKDADVEMDATEPPAKRQKVASEEEEERYIGASERIREALTSVGAV